MAEPMVQDGPLAGYFACECMFTYQSCWVKAWRSIHTQVSLTSILVFPGDSNAYRGMGREAPS